MLYHIRQIIQGGRKMKIGLIVAIEMDSIFQHYGEIEKLTSPKGFELYKTQKGENEIFILRTGMGEIAAAAGTQYLITFCGVKVIVNYGVVGGLTHEMGKHKVCLIERVVHYKYDCSEFLELKIGQVDGHDSIYLFTDPLLLSKALEVSGALVKATCCSGDKFIGTEKEKAQLHSDFGGDVCDMESAGIVLTCELNDVPCLMFKAVSDGLSGGAGEFFDELNKASLLCLEAADEVISAL